MIPREIMTILFSLIALASVSLGEEPLARPDLVDRLLDMPAPAPKWTARNVDYVPPGDAPLEELLDFWSADRLQVWGNGLTPTEAVRRRLLAACVEQSGHFLEMFRFFPETPQAYEAVKALYDKSKGPLENDAATRSTAHDWLMVRSSYFRADLISIAAGESHDAESIVNIEDAMAALARLDWPAADPVLRKRATAGNSALAVWALVLEYRHALAAADRPAENELREKLKHIAGDSKQIIDTRELAIEALLANSWEGRTGWIASLLDDPKLAHLAGPSRAHVGSVEYTSAYDGYDPFINAMKDAPDQFIPILAKRLAEKDDTIRQTAAERLLAFSRADALRPLLPWLGDSAWWAGNGRAKLLSELSTVELPQSVAPLSALVPESTDDTLAMIALALVKQHAPNAAATLRKSIDEGDIEFFRLGDGGKLRPPAPVNDLVRAAIELGVLTNDEIVTFIEAYAEQRAADAEEQKHSYWIGRGDTYWSRQARVGAALVPLSTLRPGITEKLLKRWLLLRVAKGDVAAALWDVIVTRPNKAVDEQLVRWLSETPLTEQMVKSAIVRAVTLRVHAAIKLQALTRHGGESAGVAAAVLGDRETVRSILEGRDRKAGLMLLACARLGRLPLPLDVVGKAMDSPDARLPHAAEQYLMCEDSLEARGLVLARHRGEALVLGADDESFQPDSSYSRHPFEEPYRQEVLSKDGPQEIIAMMGQCMVGDIGSCIIRIRAGAATLEVDPWAAPGKLLTRDLAPDELKLIKDFIAREHFDDLPQLDRGIIEPSFVDYLHVTRDGGRRVAMVNPGYGASAGSPHARLASLFRRISNKGTFQPHYFLETTLPGTKLLLVDAAHPIGAVWMQGHELFVRVDDEASFGSSQPAKGQWHVFAKGAVGAATAAPAGFVSAGEHEIDWPESLQVFGPQDYWKTTLADSMIVIGRSAGSDDARLYRLQKDRAPSPIGNAVVSNPVVTYDGRYVFATKADAEHAGSLVRVEISTGKATNVDLPGEHSYTAQIYVPLIDKVLIDSEDHRPGLPHGDENRYWLVDATTLKVEHFSGDVEPLLRSRGRALPAGGKGDEVWIAVQDQSPKVTKIGRYNVRSFVWTEVLTLPDIEVFNDHFAVDEAAKVMYLAVNGDLLRVPIPARKE